MRIAWLCPYLPAPANSGGRIRITELARPLSKHDLVLFCSLGNDDDEPGLLPPQALAHFQTVHSDRERTVFWSLRTPGLPRAFPRSLHKRLIEEDRRAPFDLAIAEHCYATYRLPRLSRAPLLLNEHNIESDYWLGEFWKKRAPNRLPHFVRWRAFERKSWKRADAVTAVSERDARRIEAVRGDSCLVVGNGISLEDYDYVSPSKRGGNRVLFVGMMSYEPNVVAATLLATEVIPRVRRVFPDATLTIGGRAPNARVRALESASVQVTGTVSSLRQLFNEHAVYANPVAFGGGSSLKTLEPLATGLPLVASEFAVRGYALSGGRHYLPANQPDEMADAICRVLGERARFDDIAVRGREIAESHAWSELVQPFTRLVERLSANGHSGGRSQ